MRRVQLRKRQTSPRLKWSDKILNIIKIIKDNEGAIIIKEAIDVKEKIQIIN